MCVRMHTQTQAFKKGLCNAPIILLTEEKSVIFDPQSSIGACCYCSFPCYAAMAAMAATLLFAFIATICLCKRGRKGRGSFCVLEWGGIILCD